MKSLYKTCKVHRMSLLKCDNYNLLYVSCIRRRFTVTREQLDTLEKSKYQVMPMTFRGDE